MDGILPQSDCVVLLIRASKPRDSVKDISTGTALAKVLRRRGIRHYWVWTDRVEFENISKNEISIDNGVEVFNINPKNTVALVRGGNLDSVKGGEYTLKTLQENGVHVINTVDAIKKVSNKQTFADVLKYNKIPTPKTYFVRNEKALNKLMDKLSTFPMIVKTVNGSQGVGVVKVDEKSSMKSVLQALWKFGSETIIQHMIKSEYDVRTIVIGGVIVGAMKRIRSKENKDFRNNYSQGGSIEKHKLSPQEKKVVLAAAAASGCEICGVDHIVDENGNPFVIEVNSSPGTKGFKQIYPGIIRVMVDYALSQCGKVSGPIIAGKVEKVELLGIGTFDARLDTGSDGITTLDARDIEDNFETGEIKAKINGVEHTFKRRGYVISHNANRRSEEKRPFILLDMRIGTRIARNTKVILADRSTFETPLLVSSKDMIRTNVIVDPSRYYSLGEKKQLGIDGYLNMLLD